MRLEKLIERGIMGINRKILEKLKNSINEDEEMFNTIVNLLKKESDGIGHYKKFYRKKIDNYIEKGNINEN